MRINVTGKNIDISEGLQSRVDKKIGKILNRYFDSDEEAQVRLTVDKLRNICEVTVPIKGGMIRAQESNDRNMFAAIDAVCEKLERQIHRNRTRLEKRLKETAFVEPMPETADAPFAESEPSYAISREKRFTVTPLNPEEAIEQMELLGHTFYLFLNTETDSLCAVYKRNNGTYGLLLPQV